MFMQKINRFNEQLKFTLEKGENNEINYLDLTVYVKNNEYHTKIYRKEMYSGRHLSYLSNHPFSIKKAIAISLFRKAKKFISEKGELEKEYKNIMQILEINNYPLRIIKSAFCATTKQSKNGQNREEKEKKKYINMPYIKGVTEDIKQALGSSSLQNSIGLCYQPIKTLGDVYYEYKDLNREKFKTKGCIYIIKCECGNFYVGESGRELGIRINEHRKSKINKNLDQKELRYRSAVAYHEVVNDHNIEWENVYVVTVEKEEKLRKLKDAFFIEILKPKMNVTQGLSLPPQWLHLLHVAYKKEVNSAKKFIGIEGSGV